MQNLRYLNQFFFNINLKNYMQCIQHVVLFILMYVLNQKIKFIDFSISDISEISKYKKESLYFEMNINIIQLIKSARLSIFRIDSLLFSNQYLRLSQILDK